MAFLAYLGDLHQDLAHPESRSDREGGELYAFRCQVFRKVTGFHVKSHFPDLLDAFRREKTHLPVPGARMGVAVETMTLSQQALLYVVLFFAFIVAHID
jgi:hypothetical protein